MLIIMVSLVSCEEKPASSNGNDEQVNQIEAVHNNVVKTESQSKGYLFVDISKIYHQGGELIIEMNNGEEISFNNKQISIGGNSFDIINDESKYKELLSIQSYFPEYDVFILKSEPLKNGVYEVEIGNSLAKIDSKKYANYLTFKTPEKFVLDGYPNPTEDNPLRVEPSESAKIIPDFSEFTYVSVEIRGDWLKIKDDKDCYSGEEPSEKDIVGWVRWRKNGKIILDIRHIC